MPWRIFEEMLENVSDRYVKQISGHTETSALSAPRVRLHLRGCGTSAFLVSCQVAEKLHRDETQTSLLKQQC